MTGPSPWASRLRRLASPQLSPGALGVSVLCAVLGFATVVQVRSLGEDTLERSRRDQLVQILDEISLRSTRLEEEVRTLQATRDELRSGADSRAAALAEARSRARTLSVLAGTVPVEGPGVEVSISDPNGKFGAPGLLGAVQELRAADAEAIAISGADGRTARIVVSTAFLPAGGGRVDVGGVRLASPYRITAIGDSGSLAGAMRFPRGVLAQVSGADVGGTATVVERDRLTITAVVPAPRPDQASSEPAPSS